MKIDVPILIVGLIVAFYWLRVAKLTRKIQKRTGHDANVIPREPVGRVIRVMWFPVVGVWIVYPLITAFGVTGAKPQAAMEPVFYSMVVKWVAVGLASFAMGATYVCWKLMGRSWRMGIDPNEKTKLIVTGPYAWVRHPIYALSSLLMVATVLVLPTPLMLGVALLHLLFLQLEARREEQYLIAAHGEAYQDYRQRVGRFVPRIFRRVLV